jgi:hypothetical protein
LNTSVSQNNINFSSGTIHCHGNTLAIQSLHTSISRPQATTIKPVINYLHPELIANKSATNVDIQHLVRLSLAVLIQPAQHTQKPIP